MRRFGESRRSVFRGLVAIAAVIMLMVPLSMEAYAGKRVVFSGTVTDADTGAPIPGATVVIGDNAWASGDVYRGMTDAQGNYEIGGMPNAEDYTVLANAAGYESQDLLMQKPGRVDLSLAQPAGGFLVETINEGTRTYTEQGHEYFRADGTIDESPVFFPDIDGQSATLNALMNEIGAGTDVTYDPAAMWDKARATWGWLQIHALYAPGDPVWEEAHNLLISSNYPSPADIADVYYTYGFLPWGTCMSRAHIFTTLLYRTGIPKDRVTIAETRWRLRYSQHMFTVLFMEDRWVYLDPSFNSYSMPDFSAFTSVPHGGSSFKDYRHPHRIYSIPGSGYTGVPLITDRASNTLDLFITNPPDQTNIQGTEIQVSGKVGDPLVRWARVNSVSYPVAGGVFSASVPLGDGYNTIRAEVDSGGATLADEITVSRGFLYPPGSTITVTEALFNGRKDLLTVTAESQYGATADLKVAKYDNIWGNEYLGDMVYNSKRDRWEFEYITVTSPYQVVVYGPEGEQAAVVKVK